MTVEPQPKIYLAALKAPFPADRISWRVGSTKKDKSKGLALAYIDARDVMDRLDEVCSASNWQDRYEFHGSRTVCYLSIRIGEEWVTKADGAGDSDVEAEKGAISDALKRAAVKWGIGRYLYDLESPWVDLDTYTGGDGKTYVKGIAKQEMAKLRKLVGGVSAYSLNQADAWTEFQNELFDCHSPVSLENLYRQKREAGWPAQWLEQAAEACATRKQELAGNTNAQPSGSYRDVTMAG